MTDADDAENELTNPALVTLSVPVPLCPTWRPAFIQVEFTPST